MQILTLKKGDPLHEKHILQRMLHTNVLCIIPCSTSLLLLLPGQNPAVLTVTGGTDLSRKCL